MIYSTKSVKSPVGQLNLIANSKALIAVLWENDNPDRVKLRKLHVDSEHPILLDTEKQSAEYFQRKRAMFELPLEYLGTAFQTRVWDELRAILYGATTTYGALAQKVGSPAAYRAVGSANRRNPISIIVPCHRVVGANGTLTGFAGGLNSKVILLALEGSVGTAGTR